MLSLPILRKDGLMVDILNLKTSWTKYISFVTWSLKHNIQKYLEYMNCRHPSMHLIFAAEQYITFSILDVNIWRYSKESTPTISLEMEFSRTYSLSVQIWFLAYYSILFFNSHTFRDKCIFCTNFLYQR